MGYSEMYSTVPKSSYSKVQCACLSHHLRMMNNARNPVNYSNAFSWLMMAKSLKCKNVASCALSTAMYFDTSVWICLSWMISETKAQKASHWNSLYSKEKVGEVLRMCAEDGRQAEVESDGYLNSSQWIQHKNEHLLWSLVTIMEILNNSNCFIESLSSGD